jgi:hypothetical protein
LGGGGDRVVVVYGLGGPGEEMAAIRLDMPDIAQFWNLDGKENRICCILVLSDSGRFIGNLIGHGVWLGNLFLRHHLLRR